MSKNPRFWETIPASEMTESQWESLCDGCATCCLHKIEDADTGEVFYTYVACRLLDTERCRCSEYQNRFELVPDCLKITPERFLQMDLLPETCAYRRLAEGKPLEEWHPLISNNPESVHDAGISVRGKVIPEDNIHPDEIPDCLFFKLD